MKKMITASVCAVALASVGVFATVTFDAATGTGFVGKGDVQLLGPWNNKQLQANANNVKFQAVTTQSTATTWTCDRDAGPQTQERANTTTTTTEGIVSHVARDNKNQVTGFVLSGYTGTPVVTDEHEGPQIGSCPTGWTAINQESVPGEPSGGLQVSLDGGATFQPIS